MTESYAFPAQLKVPVPNLAYDVIIQSSQISSACLATEILLRVPLLEGHSVVRCGKDSEASIQFMISILDGRRAHLASFLLKEGKLLVCHMSSPADWTSSQRVTACTAIFSNVFAALRTLDNKHIKVEILQLI